MPHYDYKCTKCGRVFELRRPIARRDDLAPCPDGDFEALPSSSSRPNFFPAYQEGAEIKPCGGFGKRILSAPAAIRIK